MVHGTWYMHNLNSNRTCGAVVSRLHSTYTHNMVLGTGYGTSKIQGLYKIQNTGYNAGYNDADPMN